VAALTVLVVDDEQSIRELLSRWLTSLGYGVRVAEDGRSALESMFANPSDILVVDLWIPNMDGFKLMERVRVKWPRTAVIVASGTSDPTAIRKAQNLGAVDYITKPFGQQALQQALELAKARIDLT